MKLFSRAIHWLFAVLFVSVLFSAQAQTGPVVSTLEIRHVGPPATSDARIRSHIRVKEGDTYQRARVDDDIRNLYATDLFYNIRAAEEFTGSGVKLTYVLQGNPTLTDIKFAGNKKFSNSKLQKKLTSKAGEPLDEKKLFTDAQEIEKRYQKAGFQKVTVKPVLSIDENLGRGTVNFEVNEGPKIKIDDIVFEGNSTFSERKLRKVLKTKRRWMFSWLTGSGVLKEEEFQDDKERLIEFYQNEGYVDFQIKEVHFEYPEPDKMIIRFDIVEGRQYHVGTIDFKGNKLFSTNDIVEGITLAGRPVKMKMLQGDIFTPKGLTENVEAIRDFYGSKGYIDTRVNAIKNANVGTGTIDLSFTLDEGDKSFVEKIDIRGNEKTKDKVLRRELAVTPGEVFDTTRVRLSKDRLEGLNFFEKVEARPEDTDIPNRKNLIVSVEEKNTGNFTIGAGFSSVDALVGFVEVSQANFDLFRPPTFTGAGQKFRLRAQIGTKRQDYQISFVEPWFLNRKLALGVDLFHRELNFVSRKDLYDETHTGGTLSLTRALWSDFLIGKVAYTLEHVYLNIDDDEDDISPEIRSEGGSRLVSKIGTSLAFDTRNSALLPNRGQRTEFLTEVAGLGGDTEFYKLEARTAWYFPGFFDGHILEIVGRAGVVEDWGSGDRGMSRVPIFDRWFLGGLYSLRGYRYRDIGPHDEFGEPLGGETYYFGSAEYSIPIIERLRFALFYDIGNVFQDAYSLDTVEGQNAFSDNWGVGVRINLPIGPLRLDYGIPINHDDDVSGGGRFQFGVGYTREF
jgi:outer membrane protein insertion porin family